MQSMISTSKPSVLVGLLKRWDHRHLTIYSRLRFGFSLLYKTVSHLNCLKAQLSYEGRAAVKGPNSISKFDHHNINGGAVDDT
jgi:hypothetical protein